MTNDKHEIATDQEVADIYEKASSGKVLHWPELVRTINRLRKAETTLSAMGGISQPVGYSVEQLCSTPIIEAMVPNDEAWDRCEHRQDRYDLMKRTIRAALEPSAPGKGEDDGGHVWHEKVFSSMKINCCMNCGFIKNEDQPNKPCPGPIRVGLRTALGKGDEAKPVAWRWVWKTTGSELEQRFSDPDLYEWTYRHVPLKDDLLEKVIVQPLYTSPPTADDGKEAEITRLKKSRDATHADCNHHFERAEKAEALIRDLAAALRTVRGIIAEGAMVGFNPLDGGDWAERLFTSNGPTSAALSRLSAAGYEEGGKNG